MSEDRMCPLRTIAQAIFMQRRDDADLNYAWMPCAGSECAMYEHCHPFSLGPDDAHETERYLESKETE